MNESNDAAGRQIATDLIAGSTTSPIGQIARGSAWLVAARWGVRGIGLVSTIILARLLEPIDFGVIAMAMTAVGLISVLSQAGQNLAVIRHPDPNEEHFDTAWTMSICTGLIVAVLLFAIAPLAGWYYHEPRVVAVIRFLALAPLIEGFTNVGVTVGFQRSFQFRRDSAFILLRKFLLLALTIPLAVVLQSYWALAAGIVGSGVLAVVASYWMHSYRPHLRLTKFLEIWKYSLWILFSAIGEFLGAQIDQIILGRLGGPFYLGNYNVAEDLAAAPTNELTLPISRAAFPVYSALLQDPAHLAQAYLGVLSMTAVMALSTGVGVALVADDMVTLVLGSNWTSASFLVPWLAIGAAMFGVGRSVNSLLSVTGNARLNAMRFWSFAVMLALMATVGGLVWGAEGVAAARMIVTILFLPIMFYTVTHAIPVTMTEIIACLWRPALASLSMVAAVSFAGTEAINSPIARLGCNVILGSIVFLLALLFLWSVAGRPAGAEHALMTHLSHATRRFATGH